MLEEAIVDMQKHGARRPGANDLLFAGDMARWVKLARTVQARLHLRLAYAPGENRQRRARRRRSRRWRRVSPATRMMPTSRTRAADGLAPALVDVRRDCAVRSASEYYVELLRGLNDPRLADHGAAHSPGD